MSVWKPSVDVKLNAKQQKKGGGGLVSNQLCQKTEQMVDPRFFLQNLEVASTGNSIVNSSCNTCFQCLFFGA